MEPDLNSSTSKEWIERKSKKYPGKKYIFNTTTVESKWLSSKKEEETLVQVKKVLKAPANERLKRLQQKLRSDEKTRKDTNKTTTKTSQTKNHKTETSVKLKPNVPSSTPTKKTALTPQERIKQKQPNVKPENNLKKSPKRSQKPNLDIRKQADNETKQKNLNKESVQISKRFKIPKITEKIISSNKTVISSTTTTNNTTIGSTARDRPIEDPGQGFSTFDVKTIDTKTTTNSNKTFKKTLIAKEFLECFEQVTTQKQLIPPKNLSAEKAAKKEKTAKETTKKIQLTPQQEHSLNITPVLETPELKFLNNIPNYNSTPIVPLKRSANQRLERLRQKLQKENKSDERAHTSDQNSNIVTNSIKVPDVILDCEEMDWEPSVETTVSCSFGPPTIHSEITQAPTEMEVDDNLMLNAADKSFNASINTKWRQTHLYIVVDTNIFINQLSFVESLKNEKSMDAAGVILYLPYSVLQELDKLKLRENIKYQVQRAIRYLNKIFETEDQHIQAQSALENRRHLIDIETADDNILNCCLQVMEHIPKVMLFSEDINLRNKAMCNNISIFKKSDFLQKSPIS